MAFEGPVPDDLSPGWRLELKLADMLEGSGPGTQRSEPMDVERMELESRLETVGWGLLFLLFGALAIPRGTAEFASVAAIGAAMLGLNLFRAIRHMPIAWFSAILGASIFAAGSGALAGVHMDAFVVFFVLAGAVTIGGAIVRPAVQSATRRDPR